jgi:hypothetical protein
MYLPCIVIWKPDDKNSTFPLRVTFAFSQTDRKRVEGTNNEI